MTDIVKDTLAQQAGEEGDETLGWDDGTRFAEGIRKEVQKELASLRKLKYSEAYIDSWRASTENIFYRMLEGSDD